MHSDRGKEVISHNEDHGVNVQNSQIPILTRFENDSMSITLSED